MSADNDDCCGKQNDTAILIWRNVSLETNASRTNDSDGGMDMSGNAMSDDSQAGLVILFTLTTCLAIVGNCFVVLVFTRGRHSRTDLRPFLINLAIADLIMAIFCMPFTFIYTMLKSWIFTKPMCPIVVFVQLLSVCGSVFTNMAIGIDRFMAVSFPLRSRLTKKRAKYVIVCIWISSIALSSVQFHVARAIDDPMGGVICEEHWPSLAARRTYTMCLFVITYLIPLSILSITYTIVGILLWKRTSPGNRDHARDQQQLRSKRKVVKMLVIVVAMFGICWLPLHLFMIVLDFHPTIMQTTDMKFLTSLFISCHWLAMSNSFANPIIYGFTNESFRADLVTMFYMWFPCCVCLTKMLPRHSSGSTYETVVFRRQSLFRQGTKGSLHYQQYRATIRAVRNASNTQQVNGHRIYNDTPGATTTLPSGSLRSNGHRGNNGYHGNIGGRRHATRETNCNGDGDASYKLLSPTANKESDLDNSISDESFKSTGDIFQDDKIG